MIHTAETRRKISEAMKGKKRSAETRRRISEAQKGKTLSAEHRRKLSEAKKGKTLSAETRRKISEAKKGKTPGAVTRRKMSEAQRGRKLSAETRRRISEAHKGDRNPCWKGGRCMADGYIWVLSPDHPSCHRSGYVYEHRLVLEAALGRFLLPGEIAHHVNGVRADNRPENLQLFPGQKEHMALHRALQAEAAP